MCSYVTVDQSGQYPQGKSIPTVTSQRQCSQCDAQMTLPIVQVKDFSKLYLFCSFRCYAKFMSID